MREAFAEDPRLRAVGEIGLDFYWKDCPSFIQEEAFRVQLALAKERIALWSSIRATRQRTPCGFWKPKVSQDAPCCGTASAATAVAFLDRFLANGWHISIPARDLSANHDLREAV